MAISNADIAALPTYTSAEQLKMWQKASIEIAAAGVSRTINGRTLTTANGDEVKKMIQFWQQQILDEADTSGGLALVRFGEAI